MRPELLGPLPLVIGLVIVAAAVASPTRAPPTPPCACFVLTPQGFDALEASGYAGVAAGGTIIVDGRVTSLYPSPLVSAPSRLVQLEGSAVRFNVSSYDAATGPVGEWVRLSTTHNGEREAQGLDLGHRWTYGGKSAPAGGGVPSLAAMAFGIALAGWGAVTWKEARTTRTRSGELKARVQMAREAQAADPAASKADAMRKDLERAGKMVRRGQFDSATTALGGIEAQLARASRLAAALSAARSALTAEEAQGFNAAPLRGILDEAERERAEGNVPDAEEGVERVMASLTKLRPLRDAVDAAARSLADSEAQGIVDSEAEERLADARQLMGQGAVDGALAEAERAHRRARDISPGAQAAKAEIERLKDFLEGRPEFDRSREVRDRVRDAEELYRLGMFARALAEARVGVWLADAESLSMGEFEAIVRSRYERLGYAVNPPGGQVPPLGFLVERLGKKSVVVTTSWRDFPGERVMFALKDFFAEGGAANAIVYSSAFTNTSTDPRIEVVDAAALVNLLRDAALDITA